MTPREAELQAVRTAENWVWPFVLAGDPRAVRLAARLLDRHAKLLGLQGGSR